MGVFYLKYRDTRPVLQVVLHDPAPLGSALGPVHDLTGSTGWKLHILLSNGSILTRTMVKVGVDIDGTLSYTWLTTDWDPGALILGPTTPLPRGAVEHRMEYEVLGPSTARMTFPNDGYDTLRIVADIGQG